MEPSERIVVYEVTVESLESSRNRVEHIPVLDDHSNLAVKAARKYDEHFDLLPTSDIVGLEKVAEFDSDSLREGSQ